MSRQRDIGGVRAVPAAPADVIAHAVLGDALQRMVQHFDAHQRIALVLLDARLRIEHVPGARKARVVELQDEAGVDDGPILYAIALAMASKNLLGALVVTVLVAAEHLDAAGGDGVMNASFDAASLRRRLQVATSRLTALRPV